MAAQLKTGASWLFGDAPTGGSAITSATVKWPASEKSYIWHAKTETWSSLTYTTPLVTQLDLKGTTEPVAIKDIVIMESELQNSEFGDKFGHKTPYPQTIGSGKGLVLTAGRAIPATWRRPTASDLPRWYAEDGSEIPLQPGNVWWLIVTDLAKVTLKLPR